MKRKGAGPGAFVRFAKGNVVLLVSAVCALATVFLIPPDEGYLAYIDWETIGCLFCVLAVANAFRLAGALECVAHALLEGLRGPRGIVFALVFSTGLLSMFVTNDMALIVMLPVATATLQRAGCCRLLPLVFVLQGLSANLCGMVMPFGNPQNLFLYSYFDLSLGDFLRTMLPFFLASVILLAVAVLLLVGRAAAPGLGGEAAAEGAVPCLKVGPGRVAAYTGLLLLSVSAVFRVLPAAAAVVVVLAALLCFDRRALRAVDYPLLLTFICFFVFAGNLARIPQLGCWLASAVQGGELLVSAGLSQIISNVPAAVLLAQFTGYWEGILVGVNIGGAGTLVGSLANLIVLQHFLAVRKDMPAASAPGSGPLFDALSVGRFMAAFTALNALFLLVLVLLGILLGV